MACASNNSPRQAQTSLTQLLNSPRQALISLGPGSSPRQSQTTLSHPENSPRQAATRYLAAEFIATYVEPTESSVQYKPASVVKFFLGDDVELTSSLQSLRVRWPRNGMLTWDGVFVHKDAHGLASKPSPLCPPGSSTYQDLILPWHTDLSRYARIVIEQAGETVELPTFLCGDPVMDGVALTWSGTDFTPYLTRERKVIPGEELPDILNDGGGVQRTAHQNASEIGSEIGIQIDCKYPDYRIRELRRGTGTPLAWLDAAARPRQAARSWRKSTLVYEQAAFRASSNNRYDWQYLDRLNIEMLSIRSNADNVHNEAEATRMEPQGRLLGECPPCSGGQCVGRTVNITLDKPSKFVLLTGKAINGVLENATGYDESGRVVATHVGPIGVLASGGAPIATIEATYKPIIGNVEYVPGYSAVQAWGGSLGTPGGSFDASYTDWDSVNNIGSRPDLRNLEDPAIPNESVATDYARLVVEESVRNTWVAVFRTPFLNPLLRPGDTIRITDWLTGTATVWFVEQLTWTWSDDGGTQMEIEAVRPWL